MNEYVKWYGEREKPFWSIKKVFLTMSAVLIMTVLSLLIWKNCAMQKINKRLIKTIEDRDRATKDAHKAIEERRQKEQMLIQQSKMAAMGEMIGYITHQWKQPLNIIAIITQDMKDAHKYGELNEQYLSDSTKNITAQVHHMSQTIDDFKGFFKPSKEKVEFEINGAIHKILSLIYKQLERALISLKLNCAYDCIVKKPLSDDMPDVSICEPAIKVKGYPSEFKHVILNLISNSRDAISKKQQQGLFKNGETGQIVIELSIAQGQKALIIITDNGGGIPYEIKERIFEPYVTIKEEGMGIGLYMSKIIIENNMGGRLYAENVSDGAAFTIEMPIA
ncbi:two-component sensor histidine kinase [Candidatus Magnetoovum chiemensis]|nr:two-component sensor histidine kinase [Candidatus Magnetoovum chiemensis]